MSKAEHEKSLVRGLGTPMSALGGDDFLLPLCCIAYLDVCQNVCVITSALPHAGLEVVTGMM